MPTHRPLTQSELNWYHAHTNWMAGQAPAGHNPNKYDWFNLMNRMSRPTAPHRTARSSGSSRTTRRTGPARSNGPSQSSRPARRPSGSAQTARPSGSARSNGQAGPSQMNVSNVMNVMNTANSSSIKSNSSSKNRPIQKRNRTTSQNTHASQVATKRTHRANTSRNSAMPAASLQTINTMMRSNQAGPSSNHVVNRPRTNSTPPPDPYHLLAYFPHQQRAIQIAQRSAKSYTDLKKMQKQRNVARPKYAFRGGMIWHGTGSGKTSTILGTITKYLEAAKKTNTKPPYLCIVTTIANERQNNLDKYIENFTKLNYDLAVQMVKNKDQEVNHCETIRVAEHLKKHISSHIKFFTYEKFASCLQLYDKNNITKDNDCISMRKDMEKKWKERGIVIILDESHELIKANTKDMTEGTKNEYQAILRTKRMLLDSVRNPFVHVYCASATPGTKISEYIETLNLVRPAGLPKFTAENIDDRLQKTNNGKTKVPGIYQFADFEDLTTKRKFFAKKTVKTIRTPITAWHYLAVLMRLMKVNPIKHESKQAIKLQAGEKTSAEAAQLVYRFYDREGYLATLRRMENWIELDDVKAIAGTAKDKGKVITQPKLFEMIAKEYYATCLKIAIKHGISTNAVKKVFPAGQAILRVKTKKGTLKVIVTPKLFTIAAKIITSPGKQFVYSHDGTSNRIVAELLEKIEGWVDITPGVEKRIIKYPDATNTRSIVAPNSHRSHDHRRYILTNDTKHIGIFQAFMSGLNMQKVGQKLKPEPGTTKRYKRNADGRACRVIFVTGDLYTGVDINALRVLHLTNPFASKVSMRQAHGRATRASGHSFLPEQHRECKVLTYMTDMPETMSDTTLNALLIPIEKQKDKEKYIAAHQWMIKKTTIQNSIRIGGRDRMNTSETTGLFPTADSIVERQATFDEETAALDHFEKMLSAKIKSQNRSQNRIPFQKK